MFSASQLGSRLQAVREQRGLSLKEVADALGLPCAYVTGLESGRWEVSVSQITKLAEIYQCSPMVFLSADRELGKDDLPAVVHRELSELDLTLEFKVALWRLFCLCGDGVALREVLNKTIELELPDYGAQRVDVPDPVRQGKDAAWKERLRLDFGNRPIGDAAKLIGRHGIWTVAADLPNGLPGLLVNHPYVGRAILVNRQYPYRRRRFFYLLGFAHALFDRSGRTVVMMRQARSSNRREIRANAFAAEFLMPQEGVAKQLKKIGSKHLILRALMGVNPADNARTEENIDPRSVFQAVTYLDIVLLGDHFVVSDEVAIGRLESLRYISSKQKKVLAKQSELVGRYIRLPGTLELLRDPALPETSEREFCRQLMCLAKEAFRQTVISRGRLIEIGREFEIKDDRLYRYVESTRVGKLNIADPL